MSKLQLVGQKFGKLTVISYAGVDKRHFSQWECRCECGKTVTVRGANLTQGAVRSCGCLRVGNNLKHNGSRTRLYGIWDGMIRRTENSTRKDYPLYGGRGIRVCEEWRNDFSAFRDWAEQNGYDDTLSIDRIDDNGNYEPSNCRWADKDTQNNNRRNTCYITLDGETKSLSEWARELDVPYARLKKRYRNGWTPEQILTT